MPKKLPESEGKRVPLNMRTTRETRERLENAAEQSGRSLAQEIEIRLERSFDFPDIVDRAISYTADKFAAETHRILDGYERIADMREAQLLEMCGGDSLFLFWVKLSAVIRAVEAERGHNIRDDVDTRDEAERIALGTIPALFRNMPETYSEFRARAASTPYRGGLANLFPADNAEGSSTPQEKG